MTHAAVDRRQLQARVIGALIVAQAVSGVGVAAGIVVGALAAEQISGSSSYGGLPQTAAVLGAALAAVPMARITARHGRRPALTAGLVAGAVGSALAALSVVVGWLWLLIPAMVLFGAGVTAGLQARFAATDLAEPSRRGRALAVVVWATTVGAVTGPNLVEPAGAIARAAGLPRLAGALLLSVVGYALAAAVIQAGLRPDPLLVARGNERGYEPTSTSPAAAWQAIRRSPPALLAFAAIATGHAVMISVMVMTPLHMAHGHATLRVIGLVFSVHILGMYAFAPLVGWAADRFGRVAVLRAGAGILLAALVCTGLSPAGSPPTLWAGLFLLGLGWSCGLVAGSTLLTESVELTDRPAVQGFADLSMGLAGAVSGLAAGVVLAAGGYDVLSAVAVLLLAPLTLLAMRKFPRPA
jgi:MFS family permease